MVGEGTFGTLYFGWVYAQGAASPLPLTAAEAKYKWGMEDRITRKPDPIKRYIKRKAGNTALPFGYYTKKSEIWNELISVETYPIDLVPFYLGHGKRTASGSDHIISLSTDGDTPDITIHGEDNELYSDQAREWYPCKSVKQSVGFKKGCLWTALDFMPAREYDVDTDSVVRSSVAKTNRGDQSTFEKFLMCHPSNEFIWELAAGNVDLSDYFQSFSYEVVPAMHAAVEDDGNDYAARLQQEAEWNKGNTDGISVKFQFAMDKLVNLLDELREYIGIGDANAADAMTAKIYKNNNDYVKFSFVNAILANFRPSVSQASWDNNIPMAELTFTQAQDIQILEDFATPNAAATYEG